MQNKTNADVAHWSYVCSLSSSVQMENSSGSGMFQSKISKENDILLGTIYAIFGKSSQVTFIYIAL